MEQTKQTHSRTPLRLPLLHKAFRVVVSFKGVFVRRKSSQVSQVNISSEHRSVPSLLASYCLFVIEFAELRLQGDEDGKEADGGKEDLPFDRKLETVEPEHRIAHVLYAWTRTVSCIHPLDPAAYFFIV